MEKINTPMFFIIGRPRSGTTLLKTILETHPNIKIPFECPLIIYLFGKYGKIKIWNNKKKNQLISDLNEIPLFNYWVIDKNNLKTSLSSMIGNYTFQEIIKKIYLNHISYKYKKNIQWIGDKNPEYTMYTKELSEIFPNSKFIFIVRDYRDHYVSIKNSKLGYPSAALTTLRWKEAIDNINKLSKIKNKVHIIKYENLVNNPKLEINKICSFLNIKYHKKMIKFYKNKQLMNYYKKRWLKIKTKNSKQKIQISSNRKLSNITKIHKSLFNPITNKKIGIYKTKLSKNEIKICNNIIKNYKGKISYLQKNQKFELMIFFISIPGYLLYKMSQLISKIIISKYIPFFIRLIIRNNLLIFQRTCNKIRV
jgi:hypothetical protein